MKKTPDIREIKEYRKRFGMTQQDIVDIIGVSVSTLQKWETGKRIPPEYVTRLIIDKLDDIFQGEEDKCKERALELNGERYLHYYTKEKMVNGRLLKWNVPEKASASGSRWIPMGTDGFYKVECEDGDIINVWTDHMD